MQSPKQSGSREMKIHKVKKAYVYGKSLCGYRNWWFYRFPDGSRLWKKVTCKNCLKLRKKK